MRILNALNLDESPRLNKCARDQSKANSAGKIFESEICIKCGKTNSKLGEINK